MFCAIWYYLYNLKSVKPKACNFTKSNTPPWVFFTFLNCTNGTKYTQRYALCVFQGVRDISFSKHFVYVLHK